MCGGGRPARRALWPAPPNRREVVTCARARPRAPGGAADRAHGRVISPIFPAPKMIEKIIIVRRMACVCEMHAGIPRISHVRTRVRRRARCGVSCGRIVDSLTTAGSCDAVCTRHGCEALRSALWGTTEAHSSRARTEWRGVLPARARSARLPATTAHARAHALGSTRSLARVSRPRADAPAARSHRRRGAPRRMSAWGRRECHGSPLRGAHRRRRQIRVALIAPMAIVRYYFRARRQNE